jgi:hemolysin activation/secretion protein
VTSTFQLAFTLRPSALALTLLLFAAGVATAQPRPDAGTLLQEMRPPTRPVPTQKDPSIKVDPAQSTGLPSSLPFEVKLIRVTGSTVFDTDALHALVRDLEGRRLTLSQLGEGAARITAHYQAHGYLLARAIVPAQAFSNGEATIQVVEARYGDIRLNNSSPVSDKLLRSTIASLQTGQAITEQALYRALLLLSDIPEVGVNSVIKPGAAVGTADLDIDTAYNPSPWGYASLDNYGNRYVGRARLSGASRLVNPFHHGDVLSLDGVTTGGGMNYVRLAYETLIDGRGTVVGGAYSAVRYELGDSVKALDAHGSAGVASLWARLPWVRSRQYNVYAQLGYDSKRLKDLIGASGIDTARHIDNAFLGLSGDARDDWVAGAMTAWNLGWTTGRVSFDDAAAEAFDAVSAQTKGRFTKWNASVSRLQGWSDRSSLLMSLAVQWADSNLDSAEKMTIGGPNSVRAYDIGAAAGDIGSSATVEFRHELGAFAGGWVQALAFIDSAHVRMNRSPWVPGENSATLTGAGFGVNWRTASQWKLSASIASRVGSAEALVANAASIRGWVAVGRSF